MDCHDIMLYTEAPCAVPGTRSERYDEVVLLFILSYDVASRSEIMPCYKIDKTTSGLYIYGKR